MVYLYVDKNQIKLFSLAKTILNQYNISHFHKKHETALLEGGFPTNPDLLASAIKEAMTQAMPKEIKERDITLILPQEAFEFARYSIPKDLSDTAILPFVKDKTRATFEFNVDETFNDYLITKGEFENEILFFAIKNESYQKYSDVFKLLGLNIKSILPESLCFYKLFEKTLKLNKKENIIYAFYDKENSYGYIYNSLGLVKEKKIYFEGDMPEILKEKVEELATENLKPNRIILSGPESDNVRQDLFTKKVGAWTNPLKKIIADFYSEYLKLFIVDKSTGFSFLNYDVCLGAFILNQENPNFNLYKAKNGFFSKAKSFTPSNNSSGKLFTIRDVGVFIGTFVLTLGAIIGLSKMGEINIKVPQIAFNRPSATPTPIPPSPTVAPTPTPSFKKTDIRINIQNGGGVKGKATEVKDIIVKLGFDQILTGNADNFDYLKTEIKVKDNMGEVFQYLKAELKPYVVIDKSLPLEKTSASDVVIIIGQDFK
jgi:hypothetical protein